MVLVRRRMAAAGVNVPMHGMAGVRRRQPRRCRTQDHPETARDGHRHEAGRNQQPHQEQRQEPAQQPSFCPEGSHRGESSAAARL